LPKPGTPRKKREFIPMEERRTTFKEVSHGLSREEAVEEAQRCLQCKKPPCVQACPSHAPARDYVKAISEENFSEAHRINRELLPLPSVLGRVCPAFCEDACILGKKFEPIAIRDLKRAACDYGEHWIPPVAPDNGKRVAVIGTGPAGLVVASDLRTKGYSVTIFERMDIPGGTLVAGIPHFRLPRNILNAEIEEVLSLGVEVRYGQTIGKDFHLDDLFEQGFDAVFVGVGAMAPKRLNIEGEDLEGVASATEILQMLALGESPTLPDRVSIIGCGNVAIDIARSTIRLGNESTILYRRTLKEAPANDEEIEEAIEEGVDIHFLCAPTRIVGDESGKVVGVECLKMELGEPDSSGRARPVPIPGTEYVVNTDMLVPAVSQSSELEWLRPEDGIELNRWGTFDVDEETGMTSKVGGFAGGDDVLGPATVVEAFSQGHVAADGIHRFLSPEVWERERKEREAREAAAKAEEEAKKAKAKEEAQKAKES
jgi:glutamate synthase (NADPH/NADH) small chain